jgi:hypothetical protein
MVGAVLLHVPGCCRLLLLLKLGQLLHKLLLLLLLVVPRRRNPHVGCGLLCCWQQCLVLQGEVCCC